MVDALELGPLDLYGDSYGTFFQQVFAGRHPDLVRSIVLDAAYPAYGETGWYPTQAPAMRHAFSVVCERSRECREGGATWRRGDASGCSTACASAPGAARRTTPTAVGCGSR